MQSKPIIGMNMDYRSAKKDSPAFSYLGRAIGGAAVGSR
jgi:hypothetical protein